MKKIGRRIAAALLAGALTFTSGSAILQGGTAEAASATTTTKKGLVKIKGKYYFYSKGSKLKKKWKTVKGYRYYFTKSGAAATGVKLINGKYYYFNSKGHLRKKAGMVTWNGKKYYVTEKGRVLTGVQLIKGKFYSFSAKGVYSSAKSKKMRAAAVYEKDFSELKALIGNPLKSEYLAGCYGSGEDGILTYKNFTVYTYRENDTEIFMGVE